MGKTNSNNSGNPDRKAANSNQRSKSKILRLNMLNSGKAIRDKEGKVVGGYLMMKDQSGNKKIEGQARIAPDRRWFGNTRVISQNELDNLREKVTAHNNNPYSFILRRKKIPMALLQESEKVAKINLLETETFESVFSDKHQRKRPKLGSSVIDYESLMVNVQAKEATSATRPADSLEGGDGSYDGSLNIASDDLFAKGQSKRIWGELYKVLDCSDVVIQVLDARNVPGTRCHHIENHLKKNAPHKQLILVLNKADLIPSWAARKWTQILGKEYPTVAFHAKLTKAFGKGALITLLRQYSKLHSDKRQISIGVIGYPNVGKSSVINTLKGEKVCKAAPVPGETKVWQYVTLTKKIFLIDCPGVVYDSPRDAPNSSSTSSSSTENITSTEVETVLKGVVRAERLKDPTDFVQPMLDRLNPRHIAALYHVQKWEDSLDFLQQVARVKGKLLPNGECDINTVAKTMINDWQRGKLPFFVPPPRAVTEHGEEDKEDDDEEEEVEEEEMEEVLGDADDDGEVMDDEEGQDEGDEDDEEE